jgi:type IX secretion system PorP/SprF family membrane protein
VEVKAQQDPQYTQYMYNMNIVNPAYAGSKENISLDFYRKQWANIEGAPSSFSFAGHGAVGNNVGLGFVFYQIR